MRGVFITCMMRRRAGGSSGVLMQTAATDGLLRPSDRCPREAEGGGGGEGRGRDAGHTLVCPSAMTGCLALPDGFLSSLPVTDQKKKI